MASTPSFIPILLGETFAARIADLYPRGWASDDAKQSGNFFALLLAFGNQLQAIQGELAYALNAQRIQTETSPELDIASVDFFGGILPRPSGMNDADYAALIIGSLFQAVATRPALQQALTRLTGVPPRMLEPWSPGDTGAWDAPVSFWNADSVVTPARWGNGGIRYQGFIETVPPGIPAIGPNNPVLGWGSVAYWNVPGYLFAILQSADENTVNDLITRLHAYGTTVWVKLVTAAAGPTVAPSAVAALTATVTGTTTVILNWQVPATGTPPFNYSVLYRQVGTTAFLPGPAVIAPNAAVNNLSPDTEYEFEIVVRNAVGFAVSNLVVAQTNAVPPSPALNLQATLVQATAVTLSWSPPLVGSPPFTFSVNWRPTGTQVWQNLIAGQGVLTLTVINLLPSTSYDFEVVTTNL